MTFSVVVTTYNRPSQLAECLEALAHLDYPRDRYEVIIVDDGGAQPLDAIVEGFAGRMNLTLLRQPNGGPASGRNSGARAAQGDLLAFTDDDCAPDPQWLHALERRLGNRPDCAAGGRVVNGLPENPQSSASQIIADVVYAWYNRDPDHATFFATNNLAVPRQTFLHCGGFDERMRIASEDREFCRRWLRDGRTLLYAGDAVVVHRHRMGLWNFVRQHYAYGRGAEQFHRTGGRFLAGGWKFYPGLVPRYARTARAHGAPLWQALPLMAVWQLANTAGFLREKLRPAHLAPPVDSTPVSCRRLPL